MTCKTITLLVALCALAAAVEPELKPPYYHGHHHFYPGPYHFNPEVAPLLAEQPLPDQEEIAEDDQAVIEGTLQDEDETEDDAPVNNLIRFSEKKDIPVICDALSLPLYSCYNCYSYLKCKPEGGKIKACKDPYAPYCNNGLCSQVPSEACANA